MEPGEIDYDMHSRTGMRGVPPRPNPPRRLP